MMQPKSRSLLCTALVAAGMAMSAGIASANDAVIVQDPSGSTIVTTTPDVTFSATPRASYRASSEYAAAVRTRDAQMAACGQRPASLKEMCVLQAQSEFDHTVTAMRLPTTQTAAVQRIEADYSNALKACAQLISSERDTCNARAQADRSKAMNDLASTTTDERVASAALQSYQSAVAACNQLPSSERDICVANAGRVEVFPSQG